MEIKKHLDNIRDLDIEIRKYFNPHGPEVKKGLEGIGQILAFFIHLQQVESQGPAQTQLASNVPTPPLTDDAKRPC